MEGRKKSNKKGKRGGKRSPTPSQPYGLLCPSPLWRGVKCFAYWGLGEEREELREWERMGNEMGKGM